MDVLSRQRLHAGPIEGDRGIRFAAKGTQEQASYESVSTHRPERCLRCVHFRQPDGCRIVEGPISPEGWCPGFKSVTSTPQLYVDLDGVLADFDAGYSTLTGKRPDRDKDDVDWRRIVSAPGFYAGLPMMSDAAVLWDFVSQFDPIILTGVPSSVPGAADDKRSWVARMLGPDVQVVCCLSREKAKQAKPGDILIDDWEKHRDKWIDAGGLWITHTSAVDTINQLRSLLSVRADAQVISKRTRADSNDPPLRAAGVMICTKDGKVLMLRRTDSGQWAFPGGRIEDGETPEQAALRECEEEIGLRPEIGSEWTRRIADGVDFTTFFSLVPEEFEPTLNEEHTDFRWLPVDDLASNSRRSLGLG